MRFPVLAVLMLFIAQASAAKTVSVPAELGALAHAIETAAPGDVLLLEKGDHAGPVIIDRALTLRGDGARIVGPGSGTVVSIEADDVTVVGLGITGSGKKLNELDSGIAIAKGVRRTVVEGNRLTGNLIGVDVQGGRDAVVRGNTIIGRDDLRRPEMGPGIYVWNAPGLLVENNDVSRGRDGIFITTSHKATYRGNVLHDLRFAIHSMYSNNLTVHDNRSHDNDMGFAFMYSTKLDVRGNLSENDWRHGIFMNFANKARVVGNEVRNGGEKCLFVYNSNQNEFTANRFQGCGVGIHFTAGSQGNTLAGNAFLGNRTQVKYVGTRWQEWSHEGQGNYWSDHVAFDIDGDGVADSPYRPNDVIDQITWQQPMAKLLIGTPAAQLVSWSQARFPGLMPGGVIDSHPKTTPGAAGVEWRTQ